MRHALLTQRNDSSPEESGWLGFKDPKTLVKDFIIYLDWASTREVPIRRGLRHRDLALGHAWGSLSTRLSAGRQSIKFAQILDLEPPKTQSVGTENILRSWCPARDLLVCWRTLSFAPLVLISHNFGNQLLPVLELPPVRMVSSHSSIGTVWFAVSQIASRPAVLFGLFIDVRSAAPCFLQGYWLLSLFVS